MKDSGSPNIFASFALLACLTACSGMSPGGGSPTEVAQGGGPVAIGNSLDSGGGGGPGGGGPLGGDGGSSGQAVPSTQQSSDSIGAPCVISFQVSVKTTRNGVPEACSNAVARIQLNDFSVDDGEMAPPDLPPAGPTVTMKFLLTPEDNPFNITKTSNTQCIEGRWQSTDSFLFRYPGNNLDCSGFHQVTAQATWLKNSQNLTSNLFQGPPLPNPDENYLTQLEVTMELGGSTGQTTGDVNTNSTVLSY